MTFRIFSSNPNKNLFYNKTPHQIMQQRCPECRAHNIDEVVAAKELGNRAIDEADEAREYTRKVYNYEDIPNNTYYFKIPPMKFEIDPNAVSEIYYFVPTEDKYSDNCEVSIKAAKSTPPKKDTPEYTWELVFPSTVNFKGLDEENKEEEIVLRAEDAKDFDDKDYDEFEDIIELKSENAEDFDDDDYDEMELRIEDAEDLTYDDYVDNDIELSIDDAKDFDEDEEAWEYMIFAKEDDFEEEDIKDSTATYPSIMELNNIIQNRKYSSI